MAYILARVKKDVRNCSFAAHKYEGFCKRGEAGKCFLNLRSGGIQNDAWCSVEGERLEKSGRYVKNLVDMLWSVRISAKERKKALKSAAVKIAFFSCFFTGDLSHRIFIA
jgi:hypothetical protein